MDKYETEDWFDPDQWALDISQTLQGEKPINVCHDDLGRLHIFQYPNEEDGASDHITLSLRQSMLVCEYAAAHREQLHNFEDISH